MWRITTSDGRLAWWCGEDEATIGVMVTELFGDADVVVERVEDRA